MTSTGWNGKNRHKRGRRQVICQLSSPLHLIIGRGDTEREAIESAEALWRKHASGDWETREVYLR